MSALQPPWKNARPFLFRPPPCMHACMLLSPFLGGFCYLFLAPPRSCSSLMQACSGHPSLGASLRQQGIGKALCVHAMVCRFCHCSVQFSNGSCFHWWPAWTVFSMFPEQGSCTGRGHPAALAVPQKLPQARSSPALLLAPASSRPKFVGGSSALGFREEITVVQRRLPAQKLAPAANGR